MNLVQIRESLEILFRLSAGKIWTLYQKLYPFTPSLVYFNSLLKKKYEFLDEGWYLDAIRKNFKNPELQSYQDEDFLRFLNGQVKAEEMVSFFQDLDETIHSENPRDLKSFAQHLRSENEIVIFYHQLQEIWMKNLFAIQTFDECPEFFLLGLLFVQSPIEEVLTLEEREKLNSLNKDEDYPLMVLLLFTLLVHTSPEKSHFRLFFPSENEPVFDQLIEMYRDLKDWRLFLSLMVKSLETLRIKIK